MSLETLLEYEKQWPTDVGKVFPSERAVFRGYDLHQDLKGLTWFELNLLGITNKKFSDVELSVLNYMWVGTSYPDPRIWNNRVAALAGTVRTNPAAAVSAALAVSDATIYGGLPIVRSFDFLQKAKQAIAAGSRLEHFIEIALKHDKVIYGYGRAKTNGDERVPHMMRFLKEKKLATLPTVELAFDIETILNKKKNLTMNIGALYSAIAIDFGLTQQEYHLFMTLVFSAGIGPCYMDALNKPAGAFFPIRCIQLNYIGDKKRRRLNINHKKSEYNIVSSELVTS